MILRITYIHQYFNTPANSGGTRSYEMARRLVDKGHSVAMVTSDRNSKASFGARPRITSEAGIEVHWIPVEYSNRMSFSRRIRAFGEFAARSSSTAAHLPADVVFATSTPLTIGIPGARAAKAQRAPLVFEVRDLWPAVPIAVGALRNPVSIVAAHRLEKWVYQHSARVVALSPGMADGVVATGYPRSRISVIPNGCDIEQFQGGRAEMFLSRHPELRGKRIVVYAGTLGLINDVEYLVRVASHGRDLAPDIAYVIVGEGAMLEDTRSLARELGVLNQNIFFFPPVPKSDMPHVLAAADMCVSLVADVPAMEANSANKFFDALAAARPVAVNHGGWQADLIENTCGLRLSRDPSRAAAQLTELLRDREQVLAMGTAAGELAATEFHRDGLATTLEQVLEDALLESRQHLRH